MTTILKRQFITDANGNPIGVILPLEEYALIEDILEQHSAGRPLDEKIAMIKQAANDPLVLADFLETMDVFTKADAEWWEQPQ